MARCSRCRTLKPLDDFGIDRSRRDGRSYVCRPCGSAAAYGRKLARKQRLAAVEVVHRPDPPRPVLGACGACQDRLHGPDCRRNGCACRCRAMLGLDLFEHGDPDGPSVEDQLGMVE